jgi:hypothetical protein
MSNRQRETYHSENGDRRLLCRDDDGRAFVLHKANVSSGERRLKSNSETFSEEATRVPSIKRLPA